MKQLFQVGDRAILTDEYPEGNREFLVEIVDLELNEDGSYYYECKPIEFNAITRTVPQDKLSADYKKGGAVMITFEEARAGMFKQLENSGYDVTAKPVIELAEAAADYIQRADYEQPAGYSVARWWADTCDNYPEVFDEIARYKRR